MTNETLEKGRLVKKKTQFAFTASNYWASTEYNTNNAWNVNFSSGNVNNNNKYNTNNVVRPVAALDDTRKEAWIAAFDDCCRNKKSSDNCIRYRLNYEDDLFRLANEVESGNYTPSTSICFCVTRPKLREVFAANFRDRIVHHWLMMKLNPLFEERFISQGNVSFNCRKGYGTQAAVTALKNDIFLVSDGYKDDAYVGRFDLVGFFMSIYKPILVEKLKEFVYEKYKEPDVDLVFDTLCRVIRHNPSNDCEIHGDPTLFDKLPPNKSLFHADPRRGLPIGNLTSQILANFYLSYFDEVMVKWTKERGGRYKRFVDDFTVVMPTPKLVYEAYLFAREYLNSELSVKLHDDKKYMQHYTKGVAFVGYVVKIDRVYLSNRTYGGFCDAMRNVNAICEKVERNNASLETIWLLNNAVASVNSYIGFTTHTNGYAKRLKILLQYNKIYKFAFLKTSRQVFKIRSKYKFDNLSYETDRMDRKRMSSRIQNQKEQRNAASYSLYKYYKVRGNWRRRRNNRKLQSK